MNLFSKRAVRKAREHLQADWTGWSLFKYSCMWLFSRTRRKMLRLNVPHPEQFAPTFPDKVLVAVKVTGGIGDYVVLARILRDVGTLSEALRFHVFCPSVNHGKWVFESVPAVEGVFDSVFFADVQLQYDCAMHLNQFVYFQEENVNLGKLTRLAPLFAQALAHCMRTRKRWDVFIDQHPTLDGAFAHIASALGMNRYTFIHSLLGLKPGALTLDLACDYDIADEMSSRFRRWITINTGFDSHFVMSTRHATKCYPAELWKRFVEEFKARCPDVAVIQIGAKTSSRIPGVDADLVARTSLAQAAGLLVRSLLHVDVEGGLVHVAASLGTRSVVLFGPTSIKWFAYDGNINLSSDVCGDCWWATERWMEQCPRGHVSPNCMETLDPSTIVEAAVLAIMGHAAEKSVAGEHAESCDAGTEVNVLPELAKDLEHA